MEHALHLALTSEVDVIPDKFDKFNESLGLPQMKLEEKQECFADAVAIAILSCDELKDHLPVELHNQVLPYFEKYISYITQEYLTAQRDLPF